MTPQLPERDVRSILTANRCDESVFAMVAIRGYYLDSMGVAGVNDRGVFDDAIFLVFPRGVIAFQANTDPSRQRAGIATLVPGIHRYGKGDHKGTRAFRQCEEVTVTRDGQKSPDRGYFGINIHSGGIHNTSSEGCQTIPAGQWPQFRNLAYDLLDEYENPVGKNDWGAKTPIFDYVLISETARRQGSLVVSNRYF